MSASALEPRKRPAQARSTATVEAILEAAARVLEKQGQEGFNTNAIAARAGVSIGSLYQYFPNKQALVAELSGRAARALLEELDGAVLRSKGGGLEDALSALIAAGVAWQSRRPALAKALDRLEAGLNLPSNAEGSAPAIRARIAALLAPHAPGLTLAAIETAAEDGLAIVRALIDTAEARGEPGGIALQRRILASVLGYLKALGLRGGQRRPSIAAN